MALNKIIKAKTSLNGRNLTLTDESVYDSTTPKSVFQNRHITLTFADGTVVEREFPYTNVDNTIKDEITYDNIFSKDSIVEIQVDFIYNNGSPTENLEFNYLSINYTLNCRSSLANSICGCDDCHNESRLLVEIDTNLLSAEYASLYGDEQKVQKFLDKCSDICESIKNKNCKDC